MTTTSCHFPNHFPLVCWEFSPGQGLSQVIQSANPCKSNIPNENTYDAEVSPTYIAEDVSLWTMSCNDNKVPQHILQSSRAGWMGLEATLPSGGHCWKGAGTWQALRSPPTPAIPRVCDFIWTNRWSLISTTELQWPHIPHLCHHYVALSTSIGSDIFIQDVLGHLSGFATTSGTTDDNNRIVTDCIQNFIFKILQR